MTSSQATILVAHGSRNALAQHEHERLVREVATASGLDTRGAYLEIAEPAISDAIDSAVADGVPSIVIVPCFLHPGNHVLVDIPSIVGDARDRHPNASIHLTDHLGASDQLVPLLVDLASI
ncbi:MAG: sirohydrochlorin chelatase [Microthrixaceae bacterium]